MIRSRILMSLFLTVISTLAAGCGDGKQTGGGPSLAQEYEAALQEFDPERRASQLIDVAARQRASKDSAGAKRSLDAAFKACDKVEDSTRQAATGIALAEEFYRLEEPADAKRSLKIARDATKKISERDVQALQWTSMARLQSLLDNQAMALDHLVRVEKLIDQIDSPGGRLAVLVAAAEVAHTMQKTSEADQFIESALDAAAALEKADERSQALLKIAAMQAKLSRQAAAMTSFEQARQIAADMDQPEQKANLLVDLALALSVAGEKKQARQALAEAQGVAKEILDRAIKKETLIRIHESKKSI